MGTDRLLASVPDFRSSASRDLALTNDFRTVALYHSLLTTHHSQPLLSSHIGSRSTKTTLLTCMLTTFPSHIGSRSTGKIQRVINEGYAVSIPQWFSLNCSATGWSDCRIFKFPSHNGSRSTMKRHMKSWIR